MALRFPDTVRIEVVKSDQTPFEGSFDIFNALQIENDITQPSQASFDVGDDLAVNELADFVRPGAQYRVFVNDTLRITGRVEAQDQPTTIQDGATVSYTVRTKLADAQYASADPKIRVKNSSIKDFILQLYEPLGYTEADFVFDQGVARNILSGRSIEPGKVENIDLEPLTAENARANPPETIFAAADRHLRRVGLMHWDSPDGRIVVGVPNDTQEPFYKLRNAFGFSGSENNVLSARRIQDYSGIPEVIGVFGQGSLSGYTKKKVRSIKRDDDVTAGGFYRPVIVLADGIKNQKQAERAATRELSARSRSKDAYEITVDGLAWWNGSQAIPFAIDTVADIVSGPQGGANGAYYVHKVSSKRDASEGDTTTLTVLRRGIWKL